MLQGRKHSPAIQGISASEFSKAFERMLDKFQPLRDHVDKVAVAFSGGPDSLALLQLTRQMLGPGRIVAMSVDHGLPNDVQEDKLRSMLPPGVELVHHKLDWPAMEMTPRWLLKAREKRYSVLGESCIKRNIQLLLVGHHQDDDLATMCYRAGRNSGVDGLGGMRMINPLPLISPYSGRFSENSSQVKGVFVGRPLLEFPKSKLLDTVGKSSNIQWDRDPDNKNPLFLRNNINHQLMNHPERANILHLLQSMKMLRAQLTEQITAVMKRSVILDRRNASAMLVLNDDRLLSSQSYRPLLLRIVSTLIQYGAANGKPVRAPILNELYDKLHGAYAQFAEEERQRQRRLPPQYRNLPPLPIDQTRRLDASSAAIGGGVVYPLSRTDAMRRITLFNNFSKHSKVQYGPAFLIQAQKPQKGLVLDVADVWRDYVLYDERVYIKPQGIDCGALDAYKWSIEPLMVEQVKLFEQLTASNRSLRGPLRGLLANTPMTYTFVVPCVIGRSNESQVVYFGMPTINCEVNLASTLQGLRWDVIHAGEGVMTGKFVCLP